MTVVSFTMLYSYTEADRKCSAELYFALPEQNHDLCWAEKSLHIFHALKKQDQAGRVAESSWMDQIHSSLNK